MTYRVYIMKDYKRGAVTSQVRSRRPLLILISSATLILISAWLILSNSNPPVDITYHDVPETVISNIQPEKIVEQIAAPISFIEAVHDDELAISEPQFIADAISSSLAETSQAELIDYEEAIFEPIEQQAEGLSHRVIVKSGDSLALIFSRLGLSPASLYKLMSLGKEVSQLKKLQPGQVLNFQINENELTKLKYEVDFTNSLVITKSDDGFQADSIHEELEPRIKHTKAIIKDSLFLSGKRAGLSDNLIMQLVSIYGWDIDFALDIREDDSFTLIYEEQYKDGVKVVDGPIIAAEFVNRNTPLRAVRYTHEDGHSDYYAANGDAMRKAFLRTPVNFSRISSRFSLGRKHPILNKIRAHKGVDYAASTGTPIKATGDGTVAYAGNKGGYGRTIILKHGGTYSTVYAHLHKYARGVRTGKRVKQGQTIGYVGKSGLATGPHLHYEFRVNGVHRNPLTVELPKVESINKSALPAFLQTINPMIAELDRLTGKRVLAAQQPNIASEQSNSMMEDG